MKGAWAVFISFGDGEYRAVGLWLCQVDEHELFVIDVDGHVAIAGFRIIEPSRLSGGTAFNLGMRFAGGGARL